MPRDDRNLPTGETIESLYRTGTQQELEIALGAWLRATIRRLEAEDRAAIWVVGLKAKAQFNRRRGRSQ